MKKISKIAGILFLAFTLANCSSDSDSGSAGLTVGGAGFGVGANTAQIPYNTMSFGQGDADFPNTRTFTMISTNSTEANFQSLDVSVNYPVSQASINGTYDLATATGSRYATVGFSNTNSDFGGEPQYSSGSVTITDNGSNNYTLTFTNVILKNMDNATDTKAVSGSATATFLLQ